MLYKWYTETDKWEPLPILQFPNPFEKKKKKSKWVPYQLSRDFTSKLTNIFNDIIIIIIIILIGNDITYAITKFILANH